jgi:hypothetical protein
MGFSALQGKGVHEALLARQDAEIRLIETMRRCLSQKAKCDRDYAIAVGNVAQTGLKIDRGDDLAGKSIVLHASDRFSVPSNTMSHESNRGPNEEPINRAPNGFVLYLFTKNTPELLSGTVIGSPRRIEHKNALTSRPRVL